MLKLKEQPYDLFIKGVLILVGLFPLVPFHKKPFIVVALLLASILHAKKFPKLVFKTHYLINAIVPLLCLLSLLITENIDYGINRFVKLLPLLAFPVASYLFSGLVEKKGVFKKIEKKVFTIYFLSLIIYCLLMYYYIYGLGFFSGKVSYAYSLSYVQGYFFWGLHEHPIYISLYLAIGILLSRKFFLWYKKTLYKVLILLGSLFLIVTLIFLSRKGIIIGLLLALPLLLLLEQKNMNIVKKYKSFLVLSILVLLLVVSVFPISKRFSDLFNTSFSENTEVSATSSTSIRIAIYKCAIGDVVEAGLFGFGAGDVQEKLCECYEETSNILSIGKYNTHNQFLNIWLSYGIIGLLLFLYFLYINFRLAFLQKDITFLSILIVLLMALLTENILNRQNGILFFGLLINYYSFKCLALKKRTS
ncbi:O-antigen ligase family protein [uncultured Dokdonia sp.]|uniref:O-antigen ligase family protein n=1 Tax=uncultured Dokdonia sp. TaxID=575653 RepID=UPI002631AC9E|nr:O-antigen ligase family protein [uncultured Dokdonia sp.]